MDDLEVREVMTSVSARSPQGGLDRVEALADGPFGQRVEVHLEAERVERRDVPLQRVGVHERDPRRSVGCPSASR